MVHREQLAATAALVYLKPERICHICETFETLALSFHPQSAGRFQGVRVWSLRGSRLSKGF